MTELRIQEVSKTYSGGRSRTGAVQALKNVNLTIPGGMYGLLGPNGAGKSTLMRILATLQEPDTGRIQLSDILGIGYERDLAPLRTKTAYIIDQKRLQLLLRDGNQVRLIDTTGKGSTVPLPIDKDMIMRAENHYLESSGSGFNNVSNLNGELGIDLVFGPPFLSKTQDSSFVFVRVDKQGTIVCKYPFRIPVEASYTGAGGTWIIGNEKESILHIEFGKGLFKSVAFNVKINVETGVIYVKEEDKEGQRKARIPAPG